MKGRNTPEEEGRKEKEQTEKGRKKKNKPPNQTCKVSEGLGLCVGWPAQCEVSNLESSGQSCPCSRQQIQRVSPEKVHDYDYLSAMGYGKTGVSRLPCHNRREDRMYVVTNGHGCLSQASEDLHRHKKSRTLATFHSITRMLCCFKFGCRSFLRRHPPLNCNRNLLKSNNKIFFCFFNTQNCTRLLASLLSSYGRHFGGALSIEM